MNRTLRALQRRLLQAVPIILAIVAINFLLLNLAPGDMVDVMAAEEQIAKPEVRERLRAEYGLDRPLAVQLARYVWSAARLDLGYSFRHSEPVWDVLARRLPATLLLMGTSMGVALVIGVLRILVNWSLPVIIIGGYLLVIAVTTIAPQEIVSIAYDSGGVATSTVTVPLVTALGIGLASSLRGRNPLTDGFGIIALAALMPILFVLVFGIIVR